MEDDKGDTHYPPNEPEEEIPYDFQCCVCLELLYKPVVLPCGHISCFWCVLTAMVNGRESQCPMCRHPYHHFPSVCQLLNSMLLQLYPVAYKRRERQITDKEKESGCFSPQFDNHLSASNPSIKLNIIDGASSHDVSSLGSCSTTEEKSSSILERIESFDFSNKDLICAVCEELLYLPVVLNCGHVYCEACIISPHNVDPKCKICGSSHPGGYINVCLVLEQFLTMQFFEQYAARKKDIVKQVGTENGSQAYSSKSQTISTQLSSHSSNRHLQGLKVHHRCGCDYCGMFPIVGERYNCRDCSDNVGFDLCETCYNNPPNIQARFNQQHKPDHRLKIVQFTNAPEHDDDTESDDDIGYGLWIDS